ncbi:MAG: ATPase, T2SS/T4P/T4SS family [Candidatus Omnitrophota bacterium]
MKQWSKLLGLLLMAAIAAAAYSDAIYLKNGKKIEGIVKDSGGEEILIQTAGGVFSFKKDAIDRIEKSSPLSNILSQAKVEELRGNYAEAISKYSDANRLAQADEEKRNVYSLQESAIQKYVQNLETRDPLSQGLGDVAEIDGLKRKISDPHLLSLLQSAKMRIDNEVVQANFNEAKRQETNSQFELAIEHYKIVLKNYPDHPLAQNLNPKIADLYNSLGEREFNRGKNSWENAEAAFLKALEIVPDHSRPLFFLGQIELRRNNYSQAKTYFAKVKPTALTAVEANNLAKFLARAETYLNKPDPKEVKRPEFQPRTEPQPEIDLNAVQQSQGWLTRTWNGTKKFAMDLMGGSGDAMNAALPYLGYALIAAAAIAVVWYAPVKIVMRDLPHRKVMYYNWRKIVNYTGLFGMIFYYIDRWRREEPRERCPACERAIDNYELFEKFEYDVCPYCETKIKPIFTLPAIIQTEAKNIAVARARSSGGIDEGQRELMQRLINKMMIHGRKIRASDIHIEPEENQLLVRYRVDGVLTESIPIDQALLNLIVSCIKVFCNLDIAERRLPQDGHFRRVLMGEDVNVRVSTIPTRLGEKVVLRLLDQKIATATLDRLGMRDESLQRYQTAIKSPHGLILATGPTGSGKTTLQYSSLQAINDGAKNIITVEDPIEYELVGINQIQHNTATGLTFATALRSILRQDPDVIMVGEIRDLETAAIAVNAALTGHLVFSTLHTIDTSTAMSRMIDIGVDVKLLSSAILTIVAQRLVRKLCPHCKKASTASSRELKQLGGDSHLLEGQNIYRPRGCRECSNTGYIGRTGIYEVMIPNREIREAIERGATTLDLRQLCLRAGMKTLREEGSLKILAGITSVEEVIRVTTDDVFGEPNVQEEEDIHPSNIIPLEGSG